MEVAKHKMKIPNIDGLHIVNDPNTYEFVPYLMPIYQSKQRPSRSHLMQVFSEIVK